MAWQCGASGINFAKCQVFNWLKLLWAQLCWQLLMAKMVFSFKRWQWVVSIAALEGEARRRKKSDHICFGSGGNQKIIIILENTIFLGGDDDDWSWGFSQFHLSSWEKEEVPLYKQLHLHISLPYPGVLRHTYEGEVVNIKLKNISDFRLSASEPFYFQFPNLPQLEDYHIIDSTEDHLLIIFCHGMPEANLNGALVKPIKIYNNL